MAEAIEFFKYQGAGNDFVMIDNITSGTHTLSHDQISRLCDRRFGIGADGLIELRPATEPDDAALAFVMVYYNSDGGRATFCGNGARCACAFARQLGLVEVDKEFVFRADDGLHTAVCHSDAKALVDISMRNVDEVACEPNGAYVLDTGVPHYVEFVTSVDDVDIMARAPKIRYAERYAPAGVNVNFVSKTSANSISIRTYERGVEGETLACGTGITASAIAAALSQSVRGKGVCEVQAQGGQLMVSFNIVDEHTVRSVRLCGPATFVFKGQVTI
ncbi:MAG: diaminopimelate epimerase [Marinilabiliaceae bacterium]|nr:diaminopimelate epimerase [Bacteroidales bacterium]